MSDFSHERIKRFVVILSKNSVWIILLIHVIDVKTKLGYKKYLNDAKTLNCDTSGDEKNDF